MDDEDALICEKICGKFKKITDDEGNAKLYLLNAKKYRYIFQIKRQIIYQIQARAFCFNGKNILANIVGDEGPYKKQLLI